jgi:hypothetical protein
MLRTGVLLRVIIASCLCLQAVQIAHAKDTTPSDVAGAIADIEFQCVSQWVGWAMLQKPSTDEERKPLLAWVDRLDPYMAEVQNHLVDQYRVTPQDLQPSISKIIDAIKLDYERDPAGTTKAINERCDPLIEAREAVRAVASPQRCWALKHSASMSGMLGSGGLKLPITDETMAAAMPAMLSLLGTQMWRRWAKAELVKSGQREKEAEKQIMAEQKLVQKERTDAIKQGRGVVFDETNCRKRYEAYRASTKAEKEKPVS